MAAHDFVPRVFDGRVTLFWASDDLRASFDQVEGWRILAGGGIDVHEISGGHLNIIKEPYVAELADKLRNCLKLARRQSTDGLTETVRTSIPTEQRKAALPYPKLQRAS
jgi:thioesterase domain-containing protein